MLLPYRSKNPPEHFPYATVTLIALNVIVYLFTTTDFLVVKDGIVMDYGVSPGELNPLRLITYMFIHEEPLHIAGNMLFLWLFGTAVEGRLRIPKFLLVYFASGIVGGLVECFCQMVAGFNTPLIGASGAIMGLAGAYIYIFPYARIMVFYFFWLAIVFLRFGSREWLAWWVIAYYMGFNVLNAIVATMFHVTGGTAFMDHIGGFGAGLLLVFALRARRDTNLVSAVQAVRADAGNDLTLLTANELETMLEAPTENMAMVVTYCGKAMVAQGDHNTDKVVRMIDRYKQPLLDVGDCDQLANILLRLPPDLNSLPGAFYLRLGGKLEQQRNFDGAAKIYRRAYDLHSSTPDGGAALMRLARLWEQIFSRPDLSQEAYKMYLAHFSKGSLAEDAKTGLDRVTLHIEGGAVPRRSVPRALPLQRQSPKTRGNEDPSAGPAGGRSD